MAQWRKPIKSWSVEVTDYVKAYKDVLTAPEDRLNIAALTHIAGQIDEQPSNASLVSQFRQFFSKLEESRLSRVSVDDDEDDDLLGVSD